MIYNNFDTETNLDYDNMLTPNQWIEVMTMNDKDRLACDLPFVQLTAYILQRDFILIPILQNDILNYTHSNKTKSSDDKTLNQNKSTETNESNKTNDNEIEHKFFIIKGNKMSTNHPPYTMLYFPDHQFGPEPHFQSIDRRYIDNTILKNELYIHFYYIVLIFLYLLLNVQLFYLLEFFLFLIQIHNLFLHIYCLFLTQDYLFL